MSGNSKVKEKRRDKKTKQVAPNVTPNIAPNITTDVALKAGTKTVSPSAANSHILNVHGISLSPEEARKAIILAEIIGPPAAKRKRRR